MSNLVIVGAGGLGLEVAAYAEDMARAGQASFAIKGFLDDTKPAYSRHSGYPVLGAVGPMFDPDICYVIAVGSPEGRKSLADKLRAGGARLTSIIHPQSYVSASAVIGEGTVIAPFAFVGPAATIGENCVINVHAVVGHESRVGIGCVLSPFAGLQGSSQLANNVFLGSHAYIASTKIGNRARIAAGAIVYSDIPADALAIGNPAAFSLSR